MTLSIQYRNFIPAAADSFDNKDKKKENYNCVKSAHIRSYSSPYFPAFGLNTKRYFLSLRIQSECGKMRTRKTPNTENFYAVHNTILMFFQNGHIANKEQTIFCFKVEGKKYKSDTVLACQNLIPSNRSKNVSGHIPKDFVVTEAIHLAWKLRFSNSLSLARS